MIFIGLRVFLIIMLFTNDGARSILTIPIGSYHIIEREMILYPLMCFWFLGELIGWGKNRRGVFDFAIFGMLGIYYVASLIGFLKGNELRNIFWSLRQVNYLLIYFPTVSSLKNTRMIKSFIKLAMVAIAISAALSIVLFLLFQGRNVYYNTEFGRVTTGMQESLYFPRVMTNASPFFSPALCVLLNFIVSPGIDKRHKRKLLCIFLLILLGLLLTLTRSYWLGFLIAFPLIFWASPVRIKKRIVGLLIILSIVFVAGIFVFKGYSLVLANRFFAKDVFFSVPIQDRLTEFSAIKTKLMADPLLGYGLGATFSFYFVSLGKIMVTTCFSHNSYLYYLLNFGIIGTLAIFIIFLIIFKKGFFLIRNTEYSYLRCLANGLLIGLFGILVSSLATANISYPSGYFFLGTCLGILTSTYRISKEEYLMEKMKNE